MSRCACSMMRVASPSETPCARLNDKVIAGNKPWWFTLSGVLDGPNFANADSGTVAPVRDLICTVFSTSGE